LFSWDAAIAEKFPECGETRDWPEVSENELWISGESKGRTGGMGSIMVVERFEVWVCLKKPQCIASLTASPDHAYLVDADSTSSWKDFFCYVFNEETEVFVPWASESVLAILDFVKVQVR